MSIEHVETQENRIHTDAQAQSGIESALQDGHAENSMENRAAITPRRGNPDKIRSHQFKPGRSGNPGGRPKEKPLTDAYRALMDEIFPGDPESRTWAKVIAMSVATKAAAGDPRAAAQIADRLEGKPSQALQLGDVDGNPVPKAITIQFVESDGNGSWRYVDGKGHPLSEWKKNDPSDD